MSKKTIILIIAVALIILSSVAFFIPRAGETVDVSEEKVCSVIKRVEEIVNGSSMSPLISPGEKIDALFGYYECHEISRGDIVIYDYAGNKNPIIKSVKAIPGDNWYLEEIDGMYEIFVNGVSLENSEGKEYRLSESSSRMLKLYVESYPIIPGNAYLLLGDDVGGSLDSTKFGLAGKSDIKAKVELKR